VSCPGLIIGAPRSGSGKTTITLGLLRAFARQGVVVAPAKCGPDYIDTAFHRRAAGRDSVNLDSWAMPPDHLASLADANAAGADVVIAEALMGFFDGVPAPAGRSGSSADVAAAMGWPLILVLDASGQAQSAAAVAKGFATYDPRTRVAGVILNKVGSERHRRLAADAIEAQGIPVLGVLARNEDIVLPERHLGLVQAEETQALDTRLDAIADLVAASVDLDRLRGLAHGHVASSVSIKPHAPAQRIAVARDAAFSFLYPHLMTAWRDAGADLVPFSPLADEAPREDCDLCWLPGGYPELHAARLAANHNFLGGLRRFAQHAPVHGECGGYMVLGRSLIDAAGERHAMAGLVELETSFAKRRLHLGYREARLRADHVLGKSTGLLRGHEFHYASVLSEDGEPFADVCDAYDGAPVASGLRAGNVSGSFFHLIAAQ
jgi:cobyrinic acid a,c-diamide synthase